MAGIELMSSNRCAAHKAIADRFRRKNEELRERWEIAQQVGTLAQEVIDLTGDSGDDK